MLPFNKFDLYLELAVRTVDRRLLELLRFPDENTSTRGEWFARWWSHGKTKQMHSSDRQKILQRIASEGLNELILKWTPGEVSSVVEHLKLESATITFYPSPFSELWAEVPLHRLKSFSENRARMNFRNVESVLTRAHTVSFPSTLECFFTLNTSEESPNAEELQKLCIFWIRAVMPSGLSSQELFGYGCVHGTCRKMLMVMSLGFPEIDQLGGRFENIYPILIGPRNSCEGLAASLNRGTVIEVSDQAPSAFLSLSPEDTKLALDTPVAQQWLVSRPKARNVIGPKVIVVPPKAKNT